MQSLVIAGGIFLLVLSLGSQAECRFDYALRYNNNRCTSCHFTPTGGGPRNIDGKLFQARWFQSNPFVIQNYVSADVRALYFHPESPQSTPSGMGIMSGSVAGHVPLDKEGEIKLVVEHNIAGFSAAPLRDTYIMYRFGKPAEYRWFESILVGRFRPAFGIVTDEHRTYTRMLTGTKWFDFNTGIMLSGTPHQTLHYDLAVVNGQNFSGQTLQQGMNEQWGAILNVRYMPGFFAVGGSARMHKTDQSYNSEAWSLYSVISLGQLTYDLVPATIKVEYTQSKGFNSVFAQGYVSNPQYGLAIQNSLGDGALAQVDWMLSKKWTLIYKYDFLKPDMHYPADTYERHGVGFVWALSAYTQLWFRSEFARASQPSEVGKFGLLAQDANYVILEASF